MYNNKPASSLSNKSLLTLKLDTEASFFLCVCEI